MIFSISLDLKHAASGERRRRTWPKSLRGQICFSAYRLSKTFSHQSYSFRVGVIGLEGVIFQDFNLTPSYSERTSNRRCMTTSSPPAVTPICPLGTFCRSAVLPNLVPRAETSMRHILSQQQLFPNNRQSLISNS